VLTKTATDVSLMLPVPVNSARRVTPDLPAVPVSSVLKDVLSARTQELV